MYEFEFEGYTKEQCDLYLERIEAEFDGKADLENLNHLIVCHQRTVPFENLAMSETGEASIWIRRLSSKRSLRTEEEAFVLN